MLQLGLPFAAVDRPEPGIYFVRQRRARRYLLRLDPEGRVRVTIPRGGSQREADLFARRHTAWIARQRERLARVPLPTEERQALRVARRAGTAGPAWRTGGASRPDRATREHPQSAVRAGDPAAGRHICLNWRLLLMPPPFGTTCLITS